MHSARVVALSVGFYLLAFLIEVVVLVLSGRSANISCEVIDASTISRVVLTFQFTTFNN